jgi:hypothetical protein
MDHCLISLRAGTPWPNFFMNLSAIAFSFEVCKTGISNGGVSTVEVTLIWLFS